jgi:PTS system mannose-specific IIA component
MIGLVLVTHGKLAEEFRHALEHVVGPQTALETVCIGPEDDMDQRRLDIVGAVSRVESGKGVIILTDMFGGTPSNLSISVMDSGRIEVIAGVNLPMLIKLAGIRGANDMIRHWLRRRMPDANTSMSPAGCWPENDHPSHSSVRTLKIVNKRGLACTRLRPVRADCGGL